MKRVISIVVIGIIIAGAAGAVYLSQQAKKDQSAESSSAATNSTDKYPIGAYFSSSIGDMPKLKELGFNLIFAPIVYQYNTEDINNTKNFLDEAKKNGLNVIVNIFVPLQHPNTLESLKTYIEAIKQEDALYGYYLMDEPELYDFVTYENLTNLNSVVKSKDSIHPTILVFSDQFDKASKYFGIADIEGFDHYPFINNVNKEQAIEEYTNFVQQYEELNKNNTKTKAYFQVLQTFSQGNKRMPSSNEISAQYDAGVAEFPKYQGVLYFAWDFPDGLNDLKRNTTIQNEIKEFNKQISLNSSDIAVIEKVYQCEDFSFSVWGECENGVQTRTIVSELPYACTGGEPVLTKQCGLITTKGAGWYPGDNHMHTSFSDGLNTVSEQVSTAVKNGMQFITITDHCTDKNLAEINAINRTDIIVIYGEELTVVPGNDILAYNIASAVSCKRPAKEMIEEVNSLSGMTFIAHPYLTGSNWFDWSLEKYNGLEVWNAFATYSAEINQKAFLKWDELNVLGKHLLGIANSDAHSALLSTDPPRENYNNRIGNPHINAYLDSFTKESIIKAIRNGSYYGTNGPEIDFKINSKMMGNDLEISSNNETVNIIVLADSAKTINRISLIKNGKEIKKWSPLKNYVQYNTTDDASPNDFYRIEVEAADTLAFSNPIWIVSKKEGIACINQDSNVDGKVSLVDLSNLLSKYNTNCSSTSGETKGQCLNQDSNNDGKISLVDLSNLLSKYNKSCN